WKCWGSSSRRSGSRDGSWARDPTRCPRWWTCSAPKRRCSEMAGDRILAVMEQRDGTLRKVSHEVLAAAWQLADAGSGAVDALVLSAGSVAGTELLGRFGADRFLSASHPDFRLYNPDGFAATIGAAAGEYAAIVFAATAAGR